MRACVYDVVCGHDGGVTERGTGGSDDGNQTVTKNPKATREHSRGDCRADKQKWVISVMVGFNERELWEGKRKDNEAPAPETKKKRKGV